MVRKFDLVYAAPKGLPLRYDLLRPDGDAPLPLVICIHGGGWISGQKEDMREVAISLVERGFAAACPEYRLAPLHPFPAPVEDLYAFVNHARASADELGVDPGRFASLGNSAGGHLAAMCGLSKFAESRVQAVVDICGISDLTEPHSQHFPISIGFLEQFMAVPFEGNEELYRLASPLHQVSQAPPPFLLIHGEADDIVPLGQSLALKERLEAAGGEVELRLLPEEGHSFSWEAWTGIEECYTGFLEEKLRFGEPAALR